MLGAPGSIGRTPVELLLGRHVLGRDVLDPVRRVVGVVGIGQVLLDLVLAPAGDRGGLPHSTRVEPDHVVTCPEALGHGGRVLHWLDAAEAGASGVVEQGAVLGVAV